MQQLLCTTVTWLGAQYVHTPLLSMATLGIRRDAVLDGEGPVCKQTSISTGKLEPNGYGRTFPHKVHLPKVSVDVENWHYCDVHVALGTADAFSLKCYQN